MNYAEEFIDEYTHFVVWYRRNAKGIHPDPKIESGWSYKGDAQYQLNEIKEVLDYAEKNKDGALDIDVFVVGRKGLKRILDIYRDDSWGNIPW